VPHPRQKLSYLVHARDPCPLSSLYHPAQKTHVEQTERPDHVSNEKRTGDWARASDRAADRQSPEHERVDPVDPDLSASRRNHLAGNTPKVAERHYLQVPDEDSERAARLRPSRKEAYRIRHSSPSLWPACGRKRPMGGKMRTIFFEEKQGKANRRKRLQIKDLGRVGFEPT
jgi:hypothetical protein